MLYKITAPNKSYNGESAGVQFQNGTALTDKEDILDWFEEKGYEIELMNDQPFVIGGKEIGKAEGDYITITDPDVIAETMKDAQESDAEAISNEATPEEKTEEAAAAEESTKTEEVAKETGKKSTGKK